MRRSVLGLDRVLTLLGGLALLAGGATLVSWRTGWPAGLWPDRRGRIDLDLVRSVGEQPWWPWACAGAGAVVVLTGLWWLLAHLPRRSIDGLLLPGSGREGRLLLDPGGPATVAAEVLTETPGVRSAHGRVRRDRGRVVVAIRAVAEPHADLGDLAAAADAVTADLHTVLGRDDITARITVSVATRRRAISRVD